MFEGDKAMNRRILAGVAALIALAPQHALAHTGVGDASGFAHGMMHPLGGIDHILAMVAVGLFAAHLGGRALWLVPASFVTMMAAGGALGFLGVQIPFVEAGIALSVIVLGAVLALQVSLPLAGAMGLVGLFAIFHGHAHGAEMPNDVSALGYGGGFLLATALLHAVGVGLGLALARMSAGPMRRISQLGGAAIVVAGLVLLAATLTPARAELSCAAQPATMDCAAR
jgi:urease accessory protein